MYKNFDEDRSRGSRYPWGQNDTQTDTHTEGMITILCTSTVAESNGRRFSFFEPGVKSHIVGYIGISCIAFMCFYCFYVFSVFTAVVCVY